MKTFLIAMSAVLLGVSVARGTPTSDKLEAEATRQAQKDLQAPALQKDYQIVTGNLTYSGIAVAAVKAENKLQLLNPVAPEKYGTAEDSVVRDPITHTVSGLKIFSIKF